MKYILALFLMLITTQLSFSQNENSREVLINDGDTSYYMKKYVMCLLTRGHNRYQSKEKAKKIQESHLNHIDSLADLGLIVLSGPFAGNDDLRAILVFDVDDVKDAESLEKQDPAVKSGRLKMEFHPWWAAKGTVLK